MASPSGWPKAQAPGAQPDGAIFYHHLTERAQVSAASLNGGHPLQLAVAGCRFNDILRGAATGELRLPGLRSAPMVASPVIRRPPPGITYSVDVAADAPDADLRQLVADCERVATSRRCCVTAPRSSPTRSACVVDRAASALCHRA